MATYSAFQDAEGRIRSYAVWAKGADTLLPRADNIALIRDEEEPIIAPWDDMLAVAGDLVEELDIYPPRFRVRTFPTEEQLARLK